MKRSYLEPVLLFYAILFVKGGLIFKKCFIIAAFIVFMIIFGGCGTHEFEPKIESTQKNKIKEEEPIKVDPSISLNETVYLPDYDINNIPISVFVLKDGAENVGIIISGHAEKTICQLASVEVVTKFEELGGNIDKFISFGIGFDIRSKSNPKWSLSYNKKIGSLVENLQGLASRFPEQVKIYNIQYNKYEQPLRLLNEHMKNLQGSLWDTHIVEYKYIESPLLIPFQYIPSGQIVTFRVPKSKFGEIPYGLAIDALTKKLNDVAQEINQMLEQNKREWLRLQSDSKDFQKFTIWIAAGDNFISEEESLAEEPKLPPEFILIEEGPDGKKIIKQITVEEARQYLEQGVDIEPDAKNILEDWIRKIDRHREYINSKKQEIRKKINEANIKLQEFLDKILEYRKKIQAIGHEDAFLIDAFLRGWPFSTTNESFNKKLDDWYNQRADVWNSILSNIPNSKSNSQLGGIFHADDVFFKVVSDGDLFEITPYKIIGGEFVQVLDKQVGITQYFTPFNFRDNEKIEK